MPRWLTLPAASVTALLVFAACSAPLGALELNYQPPEPSIAPSPKPVAPPGRPQGGETADYLGRGTRQERFSRRYRMRSSRLQQAARQTLSRL